MKYLLIFIVFVCLVNNYCNCDEEWEQFKKLYDKIYKSTSDEQLHYKQYLSTKHEILAHNQRYNEGKESYYKGVNKFSDMTLKEVQTLSMGYRSVPQVQLTGARLHEPNGNLSSLPKSVDWRTKNLVTPVKNQGGCGSCWAFSVVGALEGQHSKATKDLVSLSEQNLVDCTRDIGNYGCGGGWPYIAYEYVIRVAQGIDTENAYPYKGDDQKCNYSTTSIGAKATAFAILTPGNESILQEAVATIGPISVCIEASGNFMSYSGGLFNDKTCSPNFNRINHCVLAVGYGTDSKTGKDYWLVKNSWGTDFGEQGYIRMSRNNHNQCAISTLASYPDVFPTI